MEPGTYAVRIWHYLPSWDYLQANETIEIEAGASHSIDLTVTKHRLPCGPECSGIVAPGCTLLTRGRPLRVMRSRQALITLDVVLEEGVDGVG